MLRCSPAPSHDPSDQGRQTGCLIGAGSWDIARAFEVSRARCALTLVRTEAGDSDHEDQRLLAITIATRLDEPSEHAVAERPAEQTRASADRQRLDARVSSLGVIRNAVAFDRSLYLHAPRAIGLDALRSLCVRIRLVALACVKVLIVERSHVLAVARQRERFRRLVRPTIAVAAAVGLRVLVDAAIDIGVLDIPLGRRPPWLTGR
jgi:hypothetical protein